MILLRGGGGNFASVRGFKKEIKKNPQSILASNAVIALDFKRAFTL